jgi:hypothetical protein
VTHLKIDSRSYPVGLIADGYYANISKEVVIYEDVEKTIQIIAYDPDIEQSSFSYELDETSSDNWTGTLSIERESGRLFIIPSNDDVLLKNEKIFVTIDDGHEDGLVSLEIHLYISNTNDKPIIELLLNISLIYNQFEEVYISPTFSDIDPDDVVHIDVNIDHDIGEFKAITQVLHEANLRNGYEWTFDPATGELRLQLNDQNIWKRGDTMIDEVVIDLVFVASDSDGDSDTVSIELTLKDVNEPPPHPDMFQYQIIDEEPKKPGIQGLSVKFIASEVIDPDLDELSYIWDFGDGKYAYGIEVEHTYSADGSKTVTLVVSDGNFTTEPRVSVINLVDSGSSSGSSSNGGLSIIFILLSIIFIIILGVGTTIYFLVLRKKSEEDQTKEEGAEGKEPIQEKFNNEGNLNEPKKEEIKIEVIDREKHTSYTSYKGR